MITNVSKIAPNVAWLLIVMSSFATAERMPQDNWYLDKEWGEEGTGEGQMPVMRDLAVDSEGLVYITSLQRILVFEENGMFVREWDAPDNPWWIEAGADGKLYVASNTRSNYRLYVYTKEGIQIQKWGEQGSGEGQLDYITGMTVADDGKVFVGCRRRQGDPGQIIQVFENDGSFVRQWGSRGTSPGQLMRAAAIAIGPDNRVYVADSDPENTGIHVFELNGQFVHRWSAANARDVEVGPDGLVYVAQDRDGIGVYTPRGELKLNWKEHLENGTGVLAVNNNGKLFVPSKTNIWDPLIKVFQRSYRTFPGILPAQIPQPSVGTVTQRAGTTILDINYRVIDTDSATTENYALAFANGIKDLSHVIPVATLVEGTDSNVGTGITANSDHLLSWNAAADWSTDFGELEIEMLVNDGRDILGFDFITIPASGSAPDLTISRTPYKDPDFLNAWFWLLAKGHPSISLTSGEVVGVGGSHDGDVLASGTTTTPEGRAFLFSLVNVREATAAEVDRAQLGSNSGRVNRWTPRVSIGPGDYPVGVNEYGFETLGGAGAFWVVDLP